MINLIFLYYDNPHMLRLQMDCWNAYPDAMKSPPRILLIDDGSPKTRAADLVREIKCRVPIQVFRIQEDIPWNFAGARNLGCHHARGWIYVSDIDTLLTPEDAHQLFEGRPLQREAFYMPKRIWLRSQEWRARALSTSCFTKANTSKSAATTKTTPGITAARKPTITTACAAPRAK